MAKADVEKTRTLTFKASDESTDRYGDIVRVKGWKLDAYQKNPVVLWSHRSGDPPIARATRTAVEGDALVIDAQFAAKETYPFADTIFSLYKGGFLKAVSVGFLPLEDPKPITDENGRVTGMEFSNQELLELSCVSVPANSNALLQAVGKGIINSEQARIFKKIAPHVSDSDLWERFAASLDAEEDASTAKMLDELLRDLLHV